MTLVEFLRARLDEDEHLTREVNETVWHILGPNPEDARPIARLMHRHDPARVLAEVDAKRRIVEACEHTRDYEDHGWPLANDVLALLALPYADHCDYREEWRP